MVSSGCGETAGYRDTNTPIPIGLSHLVQPDLGSRYLAEHFMEKIAMVAQTRLESRSVAPISISMSIQLADWKDNFSVSLCDD